MKDRARLFKSSPMTAHPSAAQAFNINEPRPSSISTTSQTHVTTSLKHHLPQIHSLLLPNRTPTARPEAIPSELRLPSLTPPRAIPDSGAGLCYANTSHLQKLANADPKIEIIWQDPTPQDRSPGCANGSRINIDKIAILTVYSPKRKIGTKRLRVHCASQLVPEFILGVSERPGGYSTEVTGPYEIVGPAGLNHYAVKGSDDRLPLHQLRPLHLDASIRRGLPFQVEHVGSIINENKLIIIPRPNLQSGDTVLYEIKESDQSYFYDCATVVTNNLTAATLKVHLMKVDASGRWYPSNEEKTIPYRTLVATGFTLTQQGRVPVKILRMLSIASVNEREG
ncbi:hypothetical protein Pmar_PMAR004462 [Perkinsus marinus ATCC 50983]|uniref:Uncharacterized protein n=1 Tax=Perkinsus marinus (strain ATCC 50983 / TXsc) TaxID=423536 RepID=C5LZQ6_PERM5|nr:hypothetical protein Pmar_PMAR004462 [Perkinsus marinus ATCC 50983]EEQ97724.1 hypothetical protein Pmar_PMAR004462 [Perkinsus marinus ATCC 50983]|eukprot:XP_002765007.1 hypothetical protein Pmar_PMAR004462 [Perkinsus marinus ATCC 50983]